jgi:hypothetical protein
MPVPGSAPAGNVTITWPHAATARSAASTYDWPRGNSRNSEVCDTNTRHRAPAP